MNKKYILAVGVLVGALSTLPVYAQFFGSETNMSANTQPVRAQVTDSKPKAEETVAKPTTAAQQAIMESKEKEAVSPFNYEKSNISPEKNVRNSSEPKVKVFSKDKNADKELILLYMDDYKVYKSPSGQTRCSMRFAIMTSLPTKLSSISYRLRWSGIETALSFNNVEPQVGNQYRYTLIGDGCYTMDKAPNIVINRCRVKGLSQKACAAKVRWITRM